MHDTPISTPAGYAAAQAIGFADDNSRLALVSDASRLPVSLAAPPPAPLVGQASTSAVIGPFEAVEGRVISLELAGDFAGSAQVLRSTDGGASKLPLRAGGLEWGTFSAPGCEQVWPETEQGSTYYLDITIESGALSYKVSQ